MSLTMGVEEGRLSAQGKTSGPSLRTIIKAVWLNAVAVASLFTMVDVGWSAATVGIGRLSTALYCSFLDQLSISLPALLQKPFDLTSVKGLTLFLFSALVSSLLVASVVSAVLVPALALAEGLIAKRNAVDGNGWPWGRLVLPTVVTLVGFPGVLWLVGKLPRLWISGSAWEVAAIVALGLWGVLFAFVRPGTLVQRIVYGCVVFAATAGVVSGVGVLGFGLARPSVQQPADGANAKPPNILLVSIDSLRPDHLHSYGYPRETSSVIDQLAAEGARFTTVVAPTSWTLPSHITLLTALPPELHGVIQSWMQLKPGPVSVAEVLWQRGYETVGFVSGPFLKADYGFARGFDHYDDYTAVASSHELSHGAVTSPDLFALVRGWLQGWDSSGRERPFFLFLHMWDVHYDYTPPPPYDRLFDPDYTGTITGENFERGVHIHPEMDPRDIEHLVALYDGEIRYTDHYLGKILDLFREGDFLDDTIVVVTSDHGDEFFEHRNKGHRKALYDETILVALVIRYPRLIAPGTTVEGQVRLMDVAPTLLGLAGVEPLSGFGGSEGHAQDLGPLLRENQSAPVAPLTAYSHLHAQWASVRTEDSKLIMSLSDPAVYELYDLVNDPGEHTSLIPKRPDLAEKLESELTVWRTARRRGPSYSRDFELSEEHIRQLRALGYID
jgi:arylsulfatase A-like enzyme